MQHYKIGFHFLPVFLFEYMYHVTNTTWSRPNSSQEIKCSISDISLFEKLTLTELLWFETIAYGFLIETIHY